jgi:DNA adenine methylase
VPPDGADSRSLGSTVTTSRNRRLVADATSPDTSAVPKFKTEDTQADYLTGIAVADEPATIKSPFLKWAGRKTSIIEPIKELLPVDARRFIEPFVGSGAVFLNTDYPANILADSNADVINLYKTVQSDGERFAKRCRKLFVPENNQEARFYELRNEFNASKDVERRAELFVYLNRHCYNGLCRYNKSGGFNVPFGRYRSPKFPADEITEFAEKLTTAKLMSQDFRLTIAGAGEGDVVYCDPPYVPLSKTASFTAYATGEFGLKDQTELVACCLAAVRRGATVLISNHDTSEVRELYKDAKKIIPLLVQRMISCNGAERNKAEEVIALFA